MGGLLRLAAVEPRNEQRVSRRHLPWVERPPLVHRALLLQVEVREDCGVEIAVAQPADLSEFRTLFDFPRVHLVGDEYDLLDQAHPRPAGRVIPRRNDCLGVIAAESCGEDNSSDGPVKQHRLSAIDRVDRQPVRLGVTEQVRAGDVADNIVRLGRERRGRLIGAMDVCEPARVLNDAVDMAEQLRRQTGLGHPRRELVPGGHPSWPSLWPPSTCRWMW